MELLMSDRITNLNYSIFGRGQPLVFIHGLNGNANTWDEVSQMLRNNYCCINYDQRGHGKTTSQFQKADVSLLAYDLHDLIELLSLDDVILIGHSMGGMVIYDYVRQFGCQHIAGIIIADMSPCPMTSEGWHCGYYGDYTEEMFCSDQKKIEQNLPMFIWDFFNKMSLDPQELPESIKKRITCRLLGIKYPEVIKELWKSVFITDNRNAISSISVPLLYLLPGTFPMFPPETVQFLNENSKGPVSIKVINKSTHLLIETNPTEVLETIRDWLNINIK